MPDGNPFSALSDYERRHLVEHLDTLDDAATIHRILAADTPEHTNAWYEIKEAGDAIGSYVSDVIRARDHATAEPLPAGAEREVRYALILASIRSLAATLPLDLVRQLVETQSWTLERGIAVVRQLPDHGQRAVALASMASIAPPQQRSDLWQDARRTVAAIDNERDRGRALGLMARLGPEAYEPATLGIARGIADPYYRSLALFDCAAQAPEALARAITGEIGSDLPGITSAFRRRTLIARLLELHARLDEFPAAWDQLPDEDRRLVVSDVVPLFDKQTIDHGLSAVAAIADERERDSTTAGMVKRLTQLGEPARALALIESIQDSDISDSARGSIAVHTAANGRLDDALTMAEQLPRKSTRARVLAEIAAATSSDGWETGFDRAQRLLASVFNLAERTHIQAALARAAVAHGRMDDAVELVRAIGLPDERAKALLLIAALAPAETADMALRLATTSGFASIAAAIALLPDDSRRTALRQTLALERRIEDEADCLAAVGALGTLRADTANRALQRYARLSKDDARGRVLAALASALPAESVSAAYECARSIEDATARAEAMSALVPCMLNTGVSPEWAVTTAATLSDPEFAAWTFVELARRLSPPATDSCLTLSTQTAGQITRLPRRVRVMAQAALIDPAISDPLAKHASDGIRELCGQYDAGANIEGASMASAVATFAAPALTAEGLRMLSDALGCLRDTQYRDRAACALVQRAMELKEIQDAQRIADTITSPDLKLDARLELTPRNQDGGSADKLEALLAEATSTLAGLDRVRVIVKIAERLPNRATQIEAWTQARTLIGELAPSRSRVLAAGNEQDEHAREKTQVLAGLAASWMTVDPATGREAWSAALRELSDRSRRDVLAMLPTLVRTVIDADAAAGVAMTVSEWWP